MATYNQMQVQQKPKFSVAITTKGYQSLISNTLRDPAHARRFTASITSAVAVNPALQECDAGTILAGALLGESLNLSPSPQLGQYYLVPFKQKAKYDRNNRLIRPESVTAQFVLGYKGYIQLALRNGQYKDLDVTVFQCSGRPRTAKRSSTASPGTGQPKSHGKSTLRPSSMCCTMDLTAWPGCSKRAVPTTSS